MRTITKLGTTRVHSAFLEASVTRRSSTDISVCSHTSSFCNPRNSNSHLSIRKLSLLRALSPFGIIRLNLNLKPHRRCTQLLDPNLCPRRSVVGHPLAQVLDYEFGLRGDVGAVCYYLVDLQFHLHPSVLSSPQDCSLKNEIAIKLS